MPVRLHGPGIMKAGRPSAAAKRALLRLRMLDAHCLPNLVAKPFAARMPAGLQVERPVKAGRPGLQFPVSRERDSSERLVKICRAACEFRMANARWEYMAGRKTRGFNARPAGGNADREFSSTFVAIL